MKKLLFALKMKFWYLKRRIRYRVYPDDLRFDLTYHGWSFHAPAVQISHLEGLLRSRESASSKDAKEMYDKHIRYLKRRKATIIKDDISSEQYKLYK